MRRFEGKTVIVVGAGSVGPGWGNGKAAAALYAREGAHVLACDIDLAAAKATQEIIQKEGGVCDVHGVDVVSEESVNALFEFANDKYERIDVLHNNVGTAEIIPTADISLEAWERGVAVNLRSAFLTCRSAIPIMVAQGGGAIVNISSIADRRWVGAALVPYASAKAGLVQFTKAIAIEHAASGVRANIVVPGFMDTPTIAVSYNDTVRGEIDDMRARRSAACPMRRMGDAWDIAHAAAFLASDHAGYITGTELVVDGGLTSSIGYSA